MPYSYGKCLIKSTVREAYALTAFIRKMKDVAVVMPA